MKEDFFTVGELMAYLRVSRTWIYRLVKQGAFGPVARIGRSRNSHIRISRQAVEDYLKRNER